MVRLIFEVAQPSLLASLMCPTRRPAQVMMIFVEQPAIDVGLSRSYSAVWQRCIFPSQAGSARSPESCKYMHCSVFLHVPGDALLSADQDDPGAHARPDPCAPTGERRGVIGRVDGGSGAARAAATVTLSDASGRQRTVADGREWADFDGRRHTAAHGSRR